MTLMCSNCGEEKTVETIPEIKKVIEDGWRTVGDAVYCSECSRTWKDRNRREIPSNETDSYWRVLRIYMAEYLEEKEDYSEEIARDNYEFTMNEFMQNEMIRDEGYEYLYGCGKDE